MWCHWKSLIIVTRPFQFNPSQQFKIFPFIFSIYLTANKIFPNIYREKSKNYNFSRSFLEQRNYTEWEFWSWPQNENSDHDQTVAPLIFILTADVLSRSLKSDMFCKNLKFCFTGQDQIFVIAKVLSHLKKICCY